MLKNKVYIQCFITLVMLHIIGIQAANAQLQVKYLPGMGTGGYIPQRACFEITNSGLPMQCIAHIKVKWPDWDITTYEAESPIIDIGAGSMQVMPGFIEQYKTTFIDTAAFTAPLNLKKGSYILEISLKHSKEDTEYSFIVIPINVAVDTKVKKQNEKFSTHGSGQVMAFASTRKQAGSGMDPYYLQTNFDPTVIVYGVPISAHTYITTQGSGLGQQANTFSVNYDVLAMRALLKAKFDEAAKKDANFKKLNNLKQDADIGQYTKYKTMFENPDLKKELADLANLDTLDILKDTLAYYKKMQKNGGLTDSAITAKLKVQQPDSSNLINKIADTLHIDLAKVAMYRDSIVRIITITEKLIDKYNDLKTKKDGYEKLIKNKDELEGKLKQNGMLDSTGNVINGAKGKVEDLIDNIDNPNYYIDKLKQKHLLRPLDKFLLAINKINIGSSYPSISPFTLNGVRVNGIHVELAPKNLFAAVTYGTVLNAVQSYDPLKASYKRKLWSTTVGFGKAESSHLFFTVLSAVDDSNSVTPKDSIYTTLKLPQANYVMSAHFKVQMFKQRVSLFGELAGSQTTRDINFNNPDSSAYNTINTSVKMPGNWARNIFIQRTGSTNTIADNAFNGGVEITLFKGKTKLTSQLKRVGGYYQTFGVPFLVNDMVSIENKLTQKIWKGRIQLTGTVKHNADNITGLKQSTTSNYQFGGDIRVTIPKWPSFRASYTPLMQQNDSIRVNISLLNANLSYQYKIRKIKNTFTASYISQKSFSEQNSSLNYTSVNSLINHTTFLQNNFSVTGSVNYIRFISTELPSANTINISGSAGFSLFKNKLSNTLGATLIRNENEIRYGFFYYASLPLNEVASLNLRLENNQYNAYVVNPALTVPYFSEFTGQLTLLIKW
jgi:hypothetical protein